MGNRSSLQRQSLALLAASTVIPLAVLALFSFGKILEASDRKEAISRAVSTHEKATRFAGVLQRLDELSLEMIADPLVRNLLSASSPERADGTAQAYLADRLAMRSLAVYIKGRNGVVIRSPLSFNSIDPALVEEVEGQARPRVWFLEVASPFAVARRYLSLARRIVDIEHLSRVLGAMKVSAPLPADEELFPDEGRGAAWTLLDASGASLLSARWDDRLPAGAAAGILVAAAEADTGELELGSGPAPGRWIVSFERLGNGWILARASPPAVRADESRAALAFLAAAIALSLAFATAFDIALYRRSVAPIVRLGNAMRDLALPDLGIALKPDGRDEVARLYESFNLMNGRIRDLMAQVYASGAKQREAEIISLRARMDPHFLYNTLDAIYWMCRMEKALASADMVRNLSMIFRYNLDPGTPFASLRAELRFLESYFSLIGRRYEGRMSLGVDCPAETLDGRILRFALQPLVENAIVHGLEPAGGKGQVLLLARREGRDLVLAIEDDGKGADPAEMAALLADTGATGTRGFAVRNVHERLVLLFGPGYGLAYSAREGGGTRAELKLPWEEFADA